MPSLTSGLGHSRGVLRLRESTLLEPPLSAACSASRQLIPHVFLHKSLYLPGLGLYLWPQSPLSSPSLCTMRRPEGSASSRAFARSFLCGRTGEACSPGNPATTQVFLPGLAYLNLRTQHTLLLISDHCNWSLHGAGHPHTQLALSFLGLFWFP